MGRPTPKTFSPAQRQRAKSALSIARAWIGEVEVNEESGEATNSEAALIAAALNVVALALDGEATKADADHLEAASKMLSKIRDGEAI